jgi:hypothetical protein
MSKAEVKFPAASGGTSYALDIEDAGSLIVTDPDTMNFTGAGVTVTESPTGTAQVDIPGFSLAVQDSGTPIVSNPGTMNFTGAGVTVTNSPAGTAAVDIPDASVKFWTESESATTQQNTRWIPNNVAADVTAVVQPKGTGANTAQRPDGTTTGGNARGNYSTDWQKRRTNANQVASGTDSVIGGGRNNRASGTDSTVIGGRNNVSSGEDTISGGISNTASGSESIALGGSNTASGAYTVAIGRNNTASAEGAKVIGNSSTASAIFSQVIGGNQNTSSGTYSLASGDGSISSGAYSTALGRNSDSYLLGLRANSSGGGHQESVCVARRLADLTTGATANLSLDGTGTSNLIVPLSNNRSWTVEISWVAAVRFITGTATGVSLGDTISGKDILCLKRVTGTSSLVGATTSLFLVSDTSMSTAGLAYSIGGSNNLQLTFTAPTFAGGGTLAIRITAKVTLIEASTQS